MPTVNLMSVYADFLLGDVQSWSTRTYPKHYMRAKNPAFFVQDDIKLRPNLTVNLGVRAEIHGGATEKYKHAGGFDPNGHRSGCQYYRLSCERAGHDLV